MGCTVVVHVPVHGEAVPAQQLDPVHPDVVRLGLGVVAIVGVDGMNARKGDEASPESLVPGVVVDVGVTEIGDVVVEPGGVADGFEVAVEGPALEDGERGEIDLIAGLDNLLADPG